MLSLIDSLRAYRNRRKFKKGSIVSVRDKKRNLNLVGMLSKFDKDIAFLFMVHHIGDNLFFNTRGITVQVSSLHDPTEEELEEYFGHIYKKLSTVYVPWMKLFRKFPDQYTKGEEVFLAMYEQDSYGRNRVMKFDRYERVGSSSLYKVYCIGEEIQFSSDNIYPVEYNLAML